MPVGLQDFGGKIGISVECYKAGVGFESGTRRQSWRFVHVACEVVL
jgi:hypothetical protein